MKRIILAAAAIAALAVPVAASAAQPANPGCFGTDRANNIHNAFQADGGAYNTAPGASDWGAIAADRAGDNGAINQAYKAAPYCGQYSG